MRRPWKVFVASIGPTFSFATEERATRRATDLTEEYSEVRVWNAEQGLPMRRTVYRPGRAPLAEQFDGSRWATQ